MDLGPARRKAATEGTLFHHIELYGDDETYHPPRDPAEPTRAIPGTQERIDIYARRLESGEQLFHVDDYILTEDITDDLLGIWRKTNACSIRRRRHYWER